MYLEAKILENDNTGIINALFDGFTFDTTGHFAHCSYYLFILFFSVFIFFTLKKCVYYILRLAHTSIVIVVVSDIKTR